MEDNAMDKKGLTLDAQYLEDHDVIQRYIRHSLTADELQAFEILLIANPDLIDAIETQRMINAEFKQQLSQQLRPRYQPAPALSLLRRMLPIAATLLVGLFIGLKTIDLQHELPAQAISMPPLLLETRRGEGQAAVVALSEVAGAALPGARVRLPLRIDVGPQAGTSQHYRLQVFDPASKTVLVSAEALTASGQGWLEYPLELAASQRGSLQILVTETGSRDQQNFLINLR